MERPTLACPALPGAGTGLRGALPLAAYGLPVTLIHSSPWGPWTLLPQGESSHQAVASPGPSLPTAPPMVPWGPALVDLRLDRGLLFLCQAWRPPALAGAGAGAVGSPRAAGQVSVVAMQWLSLLPGRGNGRCSWVCLHFGLLSSLQWKSELFPP